MRKYINMKIKKIYMKDILFNWKKLGSFLKEKEKTPCMQFSTTNKVSKPVTHCCQKKEESKKKEKKKS